MPTTPTPNTVVVGYTTLGEFPLGVSVKSPEKAYFEFPSLAVDHPAILMCLIRPDHGPSLVEFTFYIEVNEVNIFQVHQMHTDFTNTFRTIHVVIPVKLPRILKGGQNRIDFKLKDSKTGAGGVSILYPVVWWKHTV